MKTFSVSIIAFLILALATTSLAITLDLDANSLDWQERVWLGVSVSNITVGGTAELSLYVDVEGNQTLDPEDFLLGYLEVNDGTTNSLGSLIIPDDDDAIADGTIHTRISYFGGPRRHIGDYIWQARDADTGATALAPLSVTQQVSSVWITGTVEDMVTSTAVPGALIETEYTSPRHGFSPFAWTAADGTFRVDIPSSVPLTAISENWASKPGLLASETGPDDDPFSIYIWTNALSGGANPLPQPLYLASAGYPELRTMSGYVYDADTNAIPGALVILENDITSMDISDTNGAYTVIFPSGTMAEELTVIPFEGPYLMRGYQEVELGTNSFSTNFYLPSADSLARARVFDADTDDPVSGVEVTFARADGAGFVGGMGYSTSNGIYEVGTLSGGNYMAEAEEDDVLPQGYAAADEYAGISIAAGTVYTNTPFPLSPGYLISGHVYDQNTNALSGGTVFARQPGDWDWIAESDVGVDGSYGLLVAAGTVEIGAMDFDGYVDGEYTGTVSVTNADVPNIDIFLDQAGTISGYVYKDDGTTPIGNLHVYAENSGNGNWAAGTDTETDGTYELSLPAGTYYVRACPSCNGQPYVDRWYDDTTSYEDANPVTVTVGTVTANINFSLPDSAFIRGTVSGTGTPLENANVFAGHPVTDEVGQIVDFTWDYNTTTTSDGSYNLPVPENSDLIVVATGPDGENWMSEIYDNHPSTDLASADLVSATLAVPATNINFDLEPGIAFSGIVFDENDNPFPDIYVEAHYDAGDHDEWAGGGSTDENGAFFFTAPTGHNYRVAVRSQDEDSSWWYPSLYYNNQFGKADATLLDGHTAGTSHQNIDFNMQVGFRVEGQVFQSDSTTPAVNGFVEIVDEGGINVSYGQCDGIEGYSVLMPTNRSFFLIGGGQDLMKEFYDNAYDQADAIPLATDAFITANVDFVLYGFDEDSDGDGLYDWREDTRPDGVYAPGEDLCNLNDEDTDSDGFTDYAEVDFLHTGPADPDDYLRWDGIRMLGDGTIRLSWPSSTQVFYRIDRSLDIMNSNAWQNIDNRYGNEGNTTLDDVPAGNNSHYRIRVDVQ